MMGMRAGTAAVAVALVAWVGLSAQQQMQPRPGPGTGVMDVRVVNHPDVRAVQGSEWLVSVGNTPDVRIANVPTVAVAGPAFLRSGGRYAITWATGEEETITVGELGAGGWIRVQRTGGSRWVNLASARSVEEAR